MKKIPVKKAHEQEVGKHFQTSQVGETPDEFPADLLPEYKDEQTIEARSQKYLNWKKATIIDKLAHAEKELEDNEIAFKALLQKKADRVLALECDLENMAESAAMNRGESLCRLEDLFKGGILSETQYRAVLDCLGFTPPTPDPIHHDPAATLRIEEVEWANSKMNKFEVKSETLPAFDPTVIAVIVHSDGSMRTSLL